MHHAGPPLPDEEAALRQAKEDLDVLQVGWPGGRPGGQAGVGSSLVSNEPPSAGRQAGSWVGFTPWIHCTAPHRIALHCTALHPRQAGQGSSRVRYPCDDGKASKGCCSRLLAGWLVHGWLAGSCASTSTTTTTTACVSVNAGPSSLLPPCAAARAHWLQGTLTTASRAVSSRAQQGGLAPLSCWAWGGSRGVLVAGWVGGCAGWGAMAGSCGACRCS